MDGNKFHFTLLFLELWIKRKFNIDFWGFSLELNRIAKRKKICLFKWQSFCVETCWKFTWNEKATLFVYLSFLYTQKYFCLRFISIPFREIYFSRNLIRKCNISLRGFYGYFYDIPFSETNFFQSSDFYNFCFKVLWEAVSTVHSETCLCKPDFYSKFLNLHNLARVTYNFNFKSTYG